MGVRKPPESSVKWGTLRLETLEPPEHPASSDVRRACDSCMRTYRHIGDTRSVSAIEPVDVHLRPTERTICD
jgi:hypothetical protein